MQINTAIFLSVLAVVSTTTFAAPIDFHEPAVSRLEDNPGTIHHHYAREFEQVQELEARSAFPVEEELEARSPHKIKATESSSPNVSRGSNRYGSKFSHIAAAIVRAHKTANARGKAGYSGRIRYTRSLPDEVQEIEARSPSYELDDIDA